MNSTNNIDIAHLSTAMNVTYHSRNVSSMDGINGYKKSTNAQAMDSEVKQVINFQLAFWKDAKEKYYQRIRDNDAPFLSDMVLVISSLVLSLTFLFGVNFQRQLGYNKTPSLLDLVHKWKLQKDNLHLYRCFCEMNDFFSIKIKHTDYNKIRSDIDKLTKEKLTSFYETTRKL